MNSGEANPSATDKTPRGAEATKEPTADAAAAAATAAAPTLQKVLGKRKAKDAAAPGASSSPPDHVSDVFIFLQRVSFLRTRVAPELLFDCTQSKIGLAMLFRCSFLETFFVPFAACIRRRKLCLGPRRKLCRDGG